MKRLAALLLGAMLMLTGCTGLKTSDLNGKNDTEAPQATVNGNNSDIDILSILTKAKTAKSFTNDAVSDSDLEIILKSGINAPSARNSQPWHFSVVKDTAILEEIASSMGSPGKQPPPTGGSAPPQGPTDGAMAPRLSITSSKVAIIISGTSKLSTDTFDCGLACQNMSITAMSLGYATKIVSSPSDAINGDQKAYFHELLGIPEGMNAVAVLMIGKSGEKVDAISGATTRNSFASVITYVNQK